MPNRRCVGAPPDCSVGSTLIHSLYQTCTPALMPSGRSRVSSEPLLGSFANSSWLSISDHVFPKSEDEYTPSMTEPLDGQTSSKIGSQAGASGSPRSFPSLKYFVFW